MIGEREELLQSLVEAMGGVMRRIHAGHSLHSSEFALSPPYLRIILSVATEREGVPVKDLAEMLNVTPGAITQFVDVLVEKDLVNRVEDQNDRRVIRVKLTELGRDRFEAFKKDYLRSATGVFDVLNDDEIRELVRILSKVKSTFTAKEQR